MDKSNSNPALVDFLPIDRLSVNPYQPREKIKKQDLEELVESIKEHGILQPILVSKTPIGYQIVAGERRWRAAKLAGLKKVPVFIKDTKRKDLLTIAIVENLQRQNLNPIEIALAFARLRDEIGLNASSIAKKVGKTYEYVMTKLRLLELPDAVKDSLLKGEIKEASALALLRLKAKALIMKAYKQIIEEEADVQRSNEIVDYLLKKLRKILGNEEFDKFINSKLPSYYGATAYLNSKKIDKIINDNIDKIEIPKDNTKIIKNSWARKVEEYLKLESTITKVKIKKGVRTAHITFTFSGDNQDELKQAIAKLLKTFGAEYKE